MRISSFYGGCGKATGITVTSHGWLGHEHEREREITLMYHTTAG